MALMRRLAPTNQQQATGVVEDDGRCRGNGHNRAVCSIDEVPGTGHVVPVGTSWCPQCGADLVAPSAYSSAWRCSDHGQVLPLSVFNRVGPAAVEHVCGQSEVPLWLPDPVPQGWSLCGLGAVGDARSRIRGTVAACNGPAPLGGDGEWLIIAEEPGIGLGAGYAGVPSLGLPASTDAPAPAKLYTLGHPTPLWAVPDTGADRSAYVGEAEGVWLWLICFPADAGYALLEDLRLIDVRGHPQPVIEVGGASNRLRPRHPG